MMEEWGGAIFKLCDQDLMNCLIIPYNIRLFRKLSKRNYKYKSWAKRNKRNIEDFEVNMQLNI